jgi:hypothetical protein
MYFDPGLWAACAERRENRLSAWLSALAFLAFSLSATLDLAELLREAA